MTTRGLVELEAVGFEFMSKAGRLFTLRWLSTGFLGLSKKPAHYFFCFGSKASRRPSPKKFKESSVALIAIAGKTSSHQ